MIERFHTPSLFGQHNDIVAMQTFRHGGVSPEPWSSLNFGSHTGDSAERIATNIGLVCRDLGIEPESLALGDQVHSTDILHITSGGTYPGVDGFITDTPGVYPCILTADCFPVLIFDPVKRAVAAVHAGWKGTAGNIAGKAVTLLNKTFGSLPANCIAFVGTGISAMAYEVGPEVAAVFKPQYLTALSNGNHTLDLALANTRQLSDAGLDETRIGRSPFCTVLDNRHFFSYRKEQGVTGRMISLIGLRPSSRAL